MLGAISLAFALAFGLPPLPGQTKTGSFSLTAPATTSGGVFDANGNLVRTLWSGTHFNAGTQNFTWDGKDQFGNTLSGSYSAKVLAHNVSYTWEGVIGNTSKNQTGNDVHRSFESIFGLAFAPNGLGFVSVGYNEQQYPMFRFHMNNYQSRLPLGHDDYQRGFSIVTADANRAYFANTGSGFNQLNFVMAFDITNTNSFPQFIFSSGSVESPGQGGQRWESVIDSGASVISGLAVQPNGNLLLAAHKGDNTVKIFDKQSGAFLRQFSVTAPQGMAATPSGDVWVICQVGGLPAIVRYSNLGSTPTAAATVSGLAMPLALAVSPDGSTVVVADGGTSQQLKAFNTAGTSVWTYGQAGGYTANGPDVTNDKFLFRDGGYWADRAYISFSPDGRIWVGDVGNERTVILDANRNYLDQIMYLPHSYSAAVDPNDPARVINYWMEFQVDYTKPIQQSWTLKKNWSAGLAKNRFSGFAEGITHLTTLTSGSTKRTFTFAPDYTTYGPDKFVMFEMPASGPLREITSVRFSENKALYPDGSVRYREDTGGQQKIWSQPFTGFDGNGNPQWGTAQLIATAPAGGNDPWYRGSFSGTSGPRFPTTQSGVVLFFDQQKKSTAYNGWHLGGVQSGSSNWKWRTSQGGRFNLDCAPSCGYQQGEIINGDGTYDDQDPYLQYGGNRVMAVGKHVVYGYHGEYWNNGQANQWMHYHENGLFIGQFGKANYPMPNRDNALAGGSGNSFSPTLVSANGKVYLWHNDESVHAGVHRWVLNGLDQIQEINVAFGGAANQSPTSSLILPLNGASFAAPAAIALAATASDADGSIAKVEFFNGATLLGTATTAPYSFAWNGVAAGSYTLTARATDNAGAATDSAQVTINVTGATGNSAPAVSLTAPANGANLGTAPAGTTLTASASDTGGSVALVEFFQNGTKIGQATAAPYSLGVSGLAAGSYTFTAKATDNLGAATTSAGVTVTVNAPTANSAPSVSLTGPANGANLGTAPVNVTLAASASDSDGSVALVEFFQNGTKVGQSTTAPYSYTVSGLSAGAYAFTAKATDNLGATATSAAATVTVNSPPVASGSANVNWNDVKQEIDGFGAATPGSAMWIKNFNDPGRSEIMELLFSPTNGVGLSIVRVEPTGDNHDANNHGSTDAGTLQPSINSIEPTEGNWNWDGDPAQVWFMQEAKKYGANRVLASVWTPPPWMKANGVYTANTGDASLRTDKYQAYADYLSRYVREYKSRYGIDITAISVQNEPDFPAWYQGCTYNPSQMVNFLKNNLGPTFKRDGVNAWVVAPEAAHWGSMDIANAVLADPGAAAAVQVIANHGYDMGYDARPSVKAAGKRLWMTETCELNAGGNPSMANALMWAKNIHNHLTVAETQAWVWWYFSEPTIDGTGGAILFQTYDAPWYTANRRTYRYPRRLPTIGQFSRFVRPGYVRLGVNANLPGGVYLSAYKDPVSGQLAVVVINDTDGTQNITVNLSGASGISAITPYVTSATQDIEPQAPLPFSGGAFNAGLVPRSVTTFVRNASPLPMPPTADAYLSDLPWVSSSIGAIDPPQRDLTAVGTYMQGGPINLKGVSYPKGLGFSAPSKIIYHLGGKCSTFTTDVGGTQGGTTRFQVYADDQLLSDTSVSPNDNPGHVSVNVTGKKFLTLVASGTGNQAVWAGAKVTYSGGPSATLTGPANNSYFPAGASVTLTADAATSSPATVARVEFYNGTTLLGSDTAAPYTFTWSGAANGTYTVTAKTVDSTGASATSAPITISVGVNQPPTVALTSPSSGATFTSPATIALAANAADPDGSVSRVEFYNGATLLGQSVTAPFSYVWTNVGAGIYSVTAKAIDNSGATVGSGAITVSVNPPVNQLPSVSLTSPANNTTFTNVPATITLTASATDGDGAVSKVEFFNGATKLGEATSAPFNFTWSGVAAGAYSVTARATDNLGGVSASAPVSLRVGAPGTPVFWRGINFGGPNVTVNGNAWMSQAAAEANGLTFSPRPNTSATSFTPVPATDAGTVAVLNSCVWSQNGFTINQAASNGTYQVYFWAMENYLNNFRNISFKLEGNTVATDVGKDWVVGQWAQYGPYEITVTDGQISLELVKVSWDPTITGMAIYSVIPGGGGTGNSVNVPPTVALTSPGNGASFTAPTSIPLAATATDSDGSIDSVEFYNGTSLLGTVTDAPYTFDYANAAPGTYAITAVAYDDKGATKTSAVANVTVVSPSTSTLSVALTSPASGSTSKSGDAITVSAAVNDTSAKSAAAATQGATTSAVGGGMDINTADLRQEIDGFGVAGIGGMAGILKHYPDPTRAQVLDLMFNTNSGAGFSIIRSEVNSDDHDKTDALWNWAMPGLNSPEPSKGNWNWTGDDHQVWMMQEAQARGVRTFMSTVWSPPPWMKDNNNYIRGSLKPANYQDFADYLSRYVREYQSRFGLPITHISPANEPNYAANYQSCDWQASQFRDLLRDYIAPTFTRDGVPSKVVIAEVNNWSGTMGMVNSTLDDAAAAARLDIVAGHGYEATPQYDYHTRAFQAGKKVWLTEDGEQLASAAVRDSDWMARQWVKVIHGYLTKAQISGWVYWYSCNLANDNYGLIYSSTARKGSGASDYPAGRGMDYKAEKSLFTISHISRFVRPGFRMLNTSFSPATDIYTLAFVNPADGQVVIVALNDTDSDYTLGGKITGNPLTSLKPYVTDTKGVRNLAPQPRTAVSGGNYSYTIPARGIVTLVRDEPQPAPPAGNAKVFVSDLRASSASAGAIGCFPVELDHNAGSEYGGDGGTLSLGGTTYAKGLGAQGSSHVTYFLGGRATSFSAMIGVDDSSSSGNTLNFQVFGDGTKLYDSGNVGKGAGQRINVNVAGKQEIALVVNGDNKANWADAFVLTGAANSAPTVSITSPAAGASFTAPASFSFAANAADADGSVARVEFYNGTNLLASDTASPYTANLSALGAGTYLLKAVAYDNAGAASAPAYVNVTVADTNVAATVLVEFFADGTKIGQAAAAPYTMTWNGASAGAHVLTAKATRSSNGETVTSPSVGITVTAGANVAPVATLTSPFGGATFSSPANITLGATASDSDGAVTKVEFYNSLNLIGTATSSPFSFAWNNVAPGTYSIFARATDNLGAIGNSAPAAITVTPPANQPPVVSLTLPTNNSAFATAPANIPLTAVASDPDGTVTKVEFYDGANLVGSATASPYNFNWLNVPAGTHSLTARATDNQGAVTTSAAVSVRVGAVGTPVFWRGINFGGNAVNIEGNQWMGQAAAEANGLTFPTRPFTSTSTVTPVPAAAGDLNTMLNSCAWAQNGFTISQAVSNGDYQVYFWVMENYQANFRDITFKVEGSIVATQVGKGWTVGQWSKYGPFDVTVTDGVLSVDLTKVAWDPEVMGMAIYRVQAANNHAPTVTLTAPSDGATLAGPANIALSATATDGDGAVSRVEFYSGSTKLVEKTSAPYTFSVTNVLPGNYAFLAVAYDNLGTVTISTTAFVTVVSPSVGANALLGDGKFQLALPAVAGATNSVEATTNLTNWVVLTNVIGGVSNQLFTDAQATNFARRFYRVRVNGVLTSNTVGFARVAVPPGYTIIANPLVPATNKVGAIFRGVPNGTTLAQFRNASNDYAVNSYDEAFNVWDDPDQPFGLGDATFILNPGTTNFTVAFSGTLPAGTQTRALPHGYQMSGVSWPQDGLLQVAHGYVPSDGDIVYRYRSNRYLISQYFAAFGAWDIEPDVKVGEGFFIFRATAGNWTRTFSLGQ